MQRARFGPCLTSNFRSLGSLRAATVIAGLAQEHKTVANARRTVVILAAALRLAVAGLQLRLPVAALRLTLP